MGEGWAAPSASAAAATATSGDVGSAAGVRRVQEGLTPVWRARPAGKKHSSGGGLVHHGRLRSSRAGARVTEPPRSFVHTAGELRPVPLHTGGRPSPGCPTRSCQSSPLMTPPPLCSPFQWLEPWATLFLRTLDLSPSTAKASSTGNSNHLATALGQDFSGSAGTAGRSAVWGWASPSGGASCAL